MLLLCAGCLGNTVVRYMLKNRCNINSRVDVIVEKNKSFDEKSKVLMKSV